MVGIAAIKFADLQNPRQADYIFDLERLTSFEGKTGPYILYQAVRIKSLLRKAGEIQNVKSFVLQDGDRKLALLMTELPEIFAAALKNYTPHVLCDYAYRLAQEFSSFYGNCHILSEADEALKVSRLQLCAMALAQLEMVTGLMGIDIPERM
jgi:arginyl-tRNA synthetase